MYNLIHTYVYTCKFLTSDNPAEKLTNKNYVGQTAHKQYYAFDTIKTILKTTVCKFFT